MIAGISIKNCILKLPLTAVVSLILLLMTPVPSDFWGSATASAADYQVTATAARGGQVAPTQRTARAGATVTFTVQPDAGYRVLDSLVGGNCPRGTWKDNTYSTGPVNADCSVSFRFYSSSHVVTAEVPRGGQVDPATRVVTMVTVRPVPGMAIPIAPGKSVVTAPWFLTSSDSIP